MEQNEFMSPEERLERIAEILAYGALRLIEKESKIPDKIVARVLAKKSTKKKPDTFLSTQEFTGIFKISRTTLWRLTKSKEIPFIKIGNSLIRYRYSDFVK